MEPSTPAEPIEELSDVFEAGARYDEIVIGAGITGLTTALLFARAGRTVAVVDARRIGEGTTGRSLGEVSLLQGARLSEVRRRNTASVTLAYAKSQEAALGWLRAFAEDSGLPVETRDAVSFALTEAGAGRLEEETRVAWRAGIPVEATGDGAAGAIPGLDLPFSTTGAIRLREQLQVDPKRLLAALAREFRASGGKIFEGVRVHRVHAAGEARLATSHGGIAAEHAILATGAPFLDRGLYFAKLSARRSHLLTSRVGTEELPTAMYRGIDSPLRTITSSGGVLTTGGASHGVGRAVSESAILDRLEADTARWWPGSDPLYSWAAQDYETPHRVPFVGWLPRGRGSIYLATGFGEWGMTNGVATAITLVADILGGGTDWQRVLHRRPTLGAAIATGIGENAAVAAWYARGWAGALLNEAPRHPAEGDGGVGRRGWSPTAVSTVDGETRALSAVSPHLGAIVRWNDLEHSWDDPSFGSRFSSDGTVIEGPAVRGLRPRP